MCHWLGGRGTGEEVLICVPLARQGGSGNQAGDQTVKGGFERSLRSRRCRWQSFGMEALVPAVTIDVHPACGCMGVASSSSLPTGGPVAHLKSYATVPHPPLRERSATQDRSGDDGWPEVDAFCRARGLRATWGTRA
jgi:hypothetical protein